MTDSTYNNGAEFLERPSVPMLDVILGKVHPVLDHGFVRLIDYMGDENAIVQAARVSYGKGTKTANDDRGLLRYLMRRRHTTPFEMCEIKLHMKLPVFVARQWIRHRTANVNEYSARYSILDREFYIPEPDAIAPQSKSNKQGREGALPKSVRQAMNHTIRQHSEMSYDIYEELNSGWPWFHEDGARVESNEPIEPHEAGHGMARELSRMVLPVNVYTQWYWKVDLHNLLHLLSLRADPHAQAEIRAYADVICDIVKMWCPRVWDAFEDYVVNAVTLSGPEMEVLRKLLAENDIAELGVPPIAGMSAREHRDFENKLGIENRDAD